MNTLTFRCQVNDDTCRRLHDILCVLTLNLHAVLNHIWHIHSKVHIDVHLGTLGTSTVMHTQVFKCTVTNSTWNLHTHAGTHKRKQVVLCELQFCDQVVCVNLVSCLKSEWWNKVLHGATVQVQGHCRGRECHKWLQLMLKAIKNYWTELCTLVHPHNLR